MALKRSSLHYNPDFSLPQTKAAMAWLQKIPMTYLVVGSLLLGLAPFTPMPHLVEKLIMLFQGALARPIDIFDLFLHAAFPVMLVIRLLLDARGAKPG